MQRKNRTNLRTIGVLMLLSQLLLMLFVARWLSAQYAEEKKALGSELERMYSKIYEQQLDAFIQNKIGAPIVDSLQTARTGGHAAPNQLSVTHSTSYSVVGAASDSSPLDFKYTSLPLMDTALLTRGIRTFMVRLSDELPGINPFRPVDTTALRQKFQAMLHQQYAALSVSWQPGKDNSPTLIINQAYQHGYISHYQLLLWRKISPQLGFSALLLLLCGMAFLLSYKTTLRQLKLNAQKDSFISNMSHELKTPVATAKVAIEALRKYEAIQDPVKTQDYLQMAAWEIDRLESLIANVLNNMQLENGRLQLLQNPVDIARLLGDMMDNLQPLFAEKQQQVTFVQQAATVTGDAQHLLGAVYNVVDNAIKYGGGTIDVLIERQDTSVTITVSDDGPGIPPEYKRRIFEKFFRIPAGNVHDVKGYGLGLNYAGYVIAAHKGTIRQENNALHGATFIITLPLSAA